MTGIPERDRIAWYLSEHGRFPERDELLAVREHERDERAFGLPAGTDLPRGLRSHGAARQDPDRAGHGRVPAGVGVDWS